MRHKSVFEQKFVRIYGENLRKAKDLANINPESITPAERNKWGFERNKFGRDLFDLQKEKLELMNQLRQEREIINRGERLEGKGAINRDITYTEDKGQGFFLVKNGDEVERATLGDLLTDVSYGIEHNIDTSQIPKELLRIYILEKAKIKIQELFDMQLLAAETKRYNSQGNKQFASFMQKMKDVRKRSIKREDYDYREQGAGLIFEQQIINLLKQIQIDMPELDISLVESDVLEDIREKIDFIFKIKRHQRGVYVEKEAQEIEPTEKVFGIQFTINTNYRKQAEKKEQIYRAKKRSSGELDDLLLITISVSQKEIGNNYKNWKKLGKPTGGPVRLYDHNTKIEILRQLLRGIGETDLVEENRDKLQKYYDDKLMGVDRIAINSNLFESR